MKKQIAILSTMFVLLVTGTAYASHQPNHNPPADEPKFHLVYCQKTGDTFKIVKGDDSSDNVNRTQVGTWDEKARGEGWNQEKANTEFLGKCPKPVEDTCPAPKFVYNERCYTAVECPAGTTIVDYEDPNTRQKPFCKGNPTGCPYAEQIPLDSAKCAPPQEWQLTPDGGMRDPETGEVYYGK